MFMLSIYKKELNSMNFIIAAMGLIILAALAIRLRMAARDEE